MTRPTALITGASAGLGAQFAQLFARDGNDVVLVARSAGRLEALAEKLRTHNVTAHVLPADLSDPAAPQQIFDQLAAKGVQVDTLVNNAGYGTSGEFLSLPLGPEAAMLEVNCVALLKLSHLFAGPMKARKSGRILNIASTAGFFPGPYMATYYATKAFVISFSEALAYELKGTGVTVTCHCPGATHTEFASRAGTDNTNLFKQPGIPSAEEVAADAYEAMKQGTPLAVHGFMNWLSVFSSRVSPRSVATAVVANLNQKN